MELILVYGLVMAALFAASFVAKRRFGLLGLALAAGSILSGVWSYDAGLVAGLFGFPGGPFTAAVVSAVIVLLPAGLLLFHGYTYKNLVARLVGATLFTILATAFLVEPLSHVLTVQGPAVNAYSMLLNNRMTVIGVGLVVAVIDLFLTKPAHSEKHRKH